MRHAKAMPASNLRANNYGETVNTEDVVGVVKIWTPSHWPLTRNGDRTIGQCIDDILEQNPGTTKLELNLDRSEF